MSHLLIENPPSDVLFNPVFGIQFNRQTFWHKLSGYLGTSVSSTMQVETRFGWQLTCDQVRNSQLQVADTAISEKFCCFNADVNFMKVVVTGRGRAL